MSGPPYKSVRFRICRHFPKGVLAEALCNRLGRSVYTLMGKRRAFYFLASSLPFYNYLFLLAHSPRLHAEWSPHSPTELATSDVCHSTSHLPPSQEFFIFECLRYSGSPAGISLSPWCVCGERKTWRLSGPFLLALYTNIHAHVVPRSMPGCRAHSSRHSVSFCLVASDRTAI